MIYTVVLSRSPNGKGWTTLGSDYPLTDTLFIGRGNDNEIQIPDGRIEYRHGQLYVPESLSVVYRDLSSIGAGLFRSNGLRISFVPPRGEGQLNRGVFIALTGTGCYYRLELSD